MSTTPAVKHRPQFVESTGFERRVHLSWAHSQKDLTIEMGRGSGDVRSSRPPSASSCEGGRNDRLGRRCRSDRLGVGDVDIGGDWPALFRARGASTRPGRWLLPLLVSIIRSLASSNARASPRATGGCCWGSWTPGNNREDSYYTEKHKEKTVVTHLLGVRALDIVRPVKRYKCFLQHNHVDLHMCRGGTPRKSCEFFLLVLWRSFSASGPPEKKINFNLRSQFSTVVDKISFTLSWLIQKTTLKSLKEKVNLCGAVQGLPNEWARTPFKF